MAARRVGNCLRMKIVTTGRQAWEGPDAPTGCRCPSLAWRWRSPLPAIIPFFSIYRASPLPARAPLTQSGLHFRSCTVPSPSLLEGSSQGGCHSLIHTRESAVTGKWKAVETAGCKDQRWGQQLPTQWTSVDQVRIRRVAERGRRQTHTQMGREHVSRRHGGPRGAGPSTSEGAVC